MTRRIQIQKMNTITIRFHRKDKWASRNKLRKMVSCRSKVARKYFGIVSNKEFDKVIRKKRRRGISNSKLKSMDVF